MNFFITGSEGFIGSHLVEYLLNQNHKVKCMVMYNSFNSLGWLEKFKKNDHRNLTIFLGDIRDNGSYENYLCEGDIVINLASLIAIPYSYSASSSYVDNNIVGINNLLNLSRTKKVKKFIHISSSEVYGSAQYVPIDEKHPINPQSPYAATKASADNLAMSYFYSYDLPVGIIRPFNTFGPRQSLRAIIPSIICQYLENKQINLGYIKSTRSFNYVDDTIRGIYSSVTKHSSVGEVINIGNDYEIMISDIVEMISEILGIKKKINIKSDRLRPKNSEVQNLSCDYSKAYKLLGWKPSISNKKTFMSYLSKTIKWYQKKSNFEKVFSSKFVY